MYWREAQEQWLTALAAEGRSVETLKGYRGHLIVFNRWAEQNIVDTSNFTPALLRRFLLEYAPRHSPQTTKAVYGNLRSWLQWLVEEGVLSTSPTEKVKAPKAAEVTKNIYSVGELKALRAYLEKTRTPIALRDTALMCALLDTGARCTELVSTTLDDL
ncbi:MAG: tyrosine-type recombinase/integrase [Chloroflexota bacterium]